MKTYNIIISFAAETDLMGLSLFLRSVMSVENAWKYFQSMRDEVMSLSILADLYHPSHYADICKYHTRACRMVSHNKRWVYVFHKEEDTVVLDRILPSKIIKG